MKLNNIDLVALVLVLVGGVNWGLVGLLDLNLVDSILTSGSLLSRLVYILVGLSAIYLAVMFPKIEKKS